MKSPRNGNCGTGVACGIIARSAGLGENTKRICACDGVGVIVTGLYSINWRKKEERKKRREKKGEEKKRKTREEKRKDKRRGEYWEEKRRKEEERKHWSFEKVRERKSTLLNSILLPPPSGDDLGREKQTGSWTWSSSMMITPVHNLM